jgi:hypothetical protein
MFIGRTHVTMFMRLKINNHVVSTCVIKFGPTREYRGRFVSLGPFSPYTTCFSWAVRLLNPEPVQRPRANDRLRLETLCVAALPVLYICAGRRPMESSLVSSQRCAFPCSARSWFLLG